MLPICPLRTGPQRTDAARGNHVTKYGMRPLPPKFFGPSGIPCVFAVDDAGNTAIGYFIQQLGLYKFRATNGTVTKIVQLAQRAEDVVDLNHMPPGTCTILVEQYGGSPQNIRHITGTRCFT